MDVKIEELTTADISVIVEALEHRKTQIILQSSELVLRVMPYVYLGIGDMPHVVADRKRITSVNAMIKDIDTLLDKFKKL